MNYVAYLTDFISVGPETMLVIPLDDAPVLYLAPAWDIPRAQEESWVGDVRPFQEFRTRLAKMAGKVGLIGREAMHVGLHDEIVKAARVKRRSTPKTSSKPWRAAKVRSSWSECGAPRRSPMPALAPCTKTRGPA